MQLCRDFGCSGGLAKYASMGRGSHKSVVRSTEWQPVSFFRIGTPKSSVLLRVLRKSGRSFRTSWQRASSTNARDSPIQKRELGHRVPLGAKFDEKSCPRNSDTEPTNSSFRTATPLHCKLSPPSFSASASVIMESFGMCSFRVAQASCWEGTWRVDITGELTRVPQECGRVQGWESVLVCWGVLEIPLLENKKGVLVCWFLVFGFLVVGFLVSWLLASWFESVLVSWFQSFKSPWILSVKYLYHITKCPFHICWKILISYPIFQTLFDGSSGFPGARPFRN